MKISGREFLRALSEYLGQAQYESEISMFVVFIISLLVVLLLFQHDKKSSISFDNIPDADLEVINAARLQRGLEEFDRDFLLEIALSFQLKPSHIFIDPAIFDRAEKALAKQLQQAGETPEQNGRYKHLQKLRKKLFPTF